MIFGNSSSTNVTLATITTDLPSIIFYKTFYKISKTWIEIGKEMAENSPFSRLETNCGSYYGNMDRCQ